MSCLRISTHTSLCMYTHEQNKYNQNFNKHWSDDAFKPVTCNKPWVLDPNHKVQKTKQNAKVLKDQDDEPTRANSENERAGWVKRSHGELTMVAHAFFPVI